MINLYILCNCGSICLHAWLANIFYYELISIILRTLFDFILLFILLPSILLLLVILFCTFWLCLCYCYCYCSCLFYYFYDVDEEFDDYFVNPDYNYDSFLLLLLHYYCYCYCYVYVCIYGLIIVCVPAHLPIFSILFVKLLTYVCNLPFIATICLILFN